MESADKWLNWKESMQNVFSNESPAFLNHFMHLWNLLCRSNFYASTLLAVIEEKQRKRNHKLKKKRQKLQENNSCDCVEDPEIDSTVKSVVEEMLIFVADSCASDLCNIATCEQDSFQSIAIDDNKIQGCLNLHAEEKASIDLHISELDIPHHVDHLMELQIKCSPPSAGSDVVSESDFNNTSVNMEHVLDDDFLSSAVRNTIQDQPSQLTDAGFSDAGFNGSLQEICSDFEYLQNLKQRRQHCSSPKQSSSIISIAEDATDVQSDHFDSNPVHKAVIKSEPIEDSVFLSHNSELPSWQQNTKETVVDDEHLVENISGMKSIGRPEKDSCNSIDEVVSMRYDSKDKKVSDEPPINSEVDLNDQSSGFNKHSTKVPCPACGRYVGIKSVNKHLDICMNRNVKREALRIRSKSLTCDEAVISSVNNRDHKIVKQCMKINNKQLSTSAQNCLASGKLGPTLRKRQSLTSSQGFTAVQSTPLLEKVDMLESLPREQQADKSFTDKANAVIPTGMQTIKNALEKTLTSNALASDTFMKEVKSIAMQMQEQTLKATNLDEKFSESRSRRKKKCRSNVKYSESVQAERPAIESCTKVEHDKCVADVKNSQKSVDALEVNGKRDDCTSKLEPTKEKSVYSDVGNITANDCNRSNDRITTNSCAPPAIDDTFIEDASLNLDIANDIPQEGKQLHAGIPKPKFPPMLKNAASQRIVVFHEVIESESDESAYSSNDEENKVLNSMPNRRSSRSTRCQKSYVEKSSDEDFDTDEEEPIKKTNATHTSMQSMSRKRKLTSHDENQIIKKEKGMHSSGAQHLVGSTSNISMDEVLQESETSTSNIDVDALLEKKFYYPKGQSLSSSITISQGVRYFNGEPIDLAQPKLLSGGVLREYQVTGFQWLKILFENGENGILADEMGLGKSIQCIAMICKLIEAKTKGPYLICAPTTTISNWFSEFKRFAPKVAVLLYHGSAPERVHLLNCLIDQLKKNQQLVVITSYEILMRDRLVLSTYNWAYLVLDEGHRVKNVNCKTLKDLRTIPARSKVMLTGTPLQNNLTELWSLLNFLFPEVFDDVKSFQRWFNMDLLQKDEKVLSMLHQVLTPFLLRRVKADVDIKIPPKREILVTVPLAPLQDKFYRATVDKSIVQLLRNKEYYTVTPGVADPDILATNSQEEETPKRITRSCLNEKYQMNADDFVINITLNNMMMQLRKCCNHPYLIQYPLVPGTDELKIDENVVLSCGKMMLLDRMLPLLKADGHKVLIFSQMTSMLDILEDYCRMRDFSFVRFDGQTSCEDRFIFIERFNSDPSIFIFLLSTRAGGLGINLTGADTVIIYDSDWNPQNDIQAQDRCHRIGQENPVLIYRLVAASTIDQRIMERATKKRTLEKMIIHKSKFKGQLEDELTTIKSLDPAQLLALLETTDADSVVEAKENVISTEDLNKMLDRSDLKWNKSEKLCRDEESCVDSPTTFAADVPADVEACSALPSMGKTTFTVVDESNKMPDVIL